MVIHFIPVTPIASHQKRLVESKSSMIGETIGEFQNHREMIHAKVFSFGVCEKNFRKESYFKTHKDMHVCNKCGVFEKFKGTICYSCKGKKKKSLLRPIKSTKKSSLTPMKSTLGRSIWKKKATASLSKFLIKSRSFRN